MEEQIHESDGKEYRNVTDKNDMLIMHFRDISHTMRDLYEGRGSQKGILIMLLKAGTVTQRELTERLGIKPGSASEVLMKLEKGNLITRTENPADRRTTDIALTDRGMELAKEAAKQRRKRHEEMFSCLSEGETETLLLLLDKINTDWRKRYGSVEDCRRSGHKHFRRDEGNCQTCEYS